MDIGCVSLTDAPAIDHQVVPGTAPTPPAFSCQPGPAGWESSVVSCVTLLIGKTWLWPQGMSEQLIPLPCPLEDNKPEFQQATLSPCNLSCNTKWVKKSQRKARLSHPQRSGAGAEGSTAALTRPPLTSPLAQNNCPHWQWGGARTWPARYTAKSILGGSRGGGEPTHPAGAWLCSPVAQHGQASSTGVPVGLSTPL